MNNNQTIYTRLLTEENALVGRGQAESIVLNASLCWMLTRFTGTPLHWLIMITYVFSLICALITIKPIPHGDLLHGDNDPEHEARLERQYRIVKFRQKTCTLSLYGLFIVFGLLLLEVIL